MRNRIIFAIAVALAASGCDRKAEGQTVAIVNGEEITASELNAELNSANLPADADKKEARSRVLQSMIDRRLLVQQARASELDKSPEFLYRQRRGTEDLLIGMLAQRQMSSAELPSAQEISRFQASRPEMFANREIWHLEQLGYQMPTDRAVNARIAATKTLDELVKALTDSKIPFTRRKNRIDTAVIPHGLYQEISALQPGEPFIVPSGNQAIASSIVSREPAPRVGEEAKPMAVAVIRREQGSKVMVDRLKALRASAKIEYGADFKPPAPAK